MNALLLTCALLAAAPSSGGNTTPAESSERAASVRILVRGAELAPMQQQALSGATRKVLSQLTSFKVPAPDAISKMCDQAQCLRKEASAEAPLVLFVSAAVPSLVLELRGVLYDSGTGAILKKTVRGGNPDAPEDAVQTLCEALLPKWARRGQASIAVRAPDDAVVKVDGRRVALTPLRDAIGVSAGLHDIDVVFKSGDAVLFRRTLEEGSRFTADASRTAALDGMDPATSRRPAALRYASYGLFSAGAVAIAGSLVAGGLSRGAARELRGCDPADRSCLRIDEANAAHARAEGYATTGNILLVTGALLSAAGTGLFAFDIAGGE